MFPLLTRTTLEKLGWGWSIRIMALIAMILLMTANLLIRGRTRELNEGKQQRKASLVDLTCFGDIRFLWVTVGISRKFLERLKELFIRLAVETNDGIVFEYVVTAALGMLPTWATIRGFDNATAFAALAVYNGSVSHPSF